MSSNALELEAKLIEMVLGKREAIIRESEKKSKEILEEAREKAKRILVEEREVKMRAAGMDLRGIRDKLLGKAEQEGRRKIMEARNEVITSVFREVEDKLRKITEGRDKTVDYHDILSKLILEGASTVGEKELVVAVNKRDREYLASRKIKIDISKALGYDVTLTIENEPIDCMGGAIIYNASKRKVFYNTLEARLQKARSGMGAEVAKALKVI
jgi:vacuolar-type H+-ATPase subunit E/Vma4